MQYELSRLSNSNATKHWDRATITGNPSNGNYPCTTLSLRDTVLLLDTFEGKSQGVLFLDNFFVPSTEICM